MLSNIRLESFADPVASHGKPKDVPLGFQPATRRCSSMGPPQLRVRACTLHSPGLGRMKAPASAARAARRSQGLEEKTIQLVSGLLQTPLPPPAGRPGWRGRCFFCTPEVLPFPPCQILQQEV